MAPCQGITAAGKQCKNAATTGQAYCRHHSGQQRVGAPSLRTPPPPSPQIRCCGITRTGDRCRRRLGTGSQGYCHHHLKQLRFQPPSLQSPLPPDLDLKDHVIQVLLSAINAYGSHQLRSISDAYLRGMGIATEPLADESGRVYSF